MTIPILSYETRSMQVVARKDSCANILGGAAENQPAEHTQTPDAASFSHVTFQEVWRWDMDPKTSRKL